MSDELPNKKERKPRVKAAKKLPKGVLKLKARTSEEWDLLFIALRPWLEKLVPSDGSAITLADFWRALAESPQWQDDEKTGDAVQIGGGLSKDDARKFTLNDILCAAQRLRLKIEGIVGPSWSYMPNGQEKLSRVTQ